MVDTDREENERRRKDKLVFPIGGGEAINPEIWKLYINPCGHGVRNNRMTYLFQPVMELMSNDTLLTPPRYQPTLWLSFWRWQAFYITV